MLFTSSMVRFALGVLTAWVTIGVLLGAAGAAGQVNPDLPGLPRSPDLDPIRPQLPPGSLGLAALKEVLVWRGFHHRWGYNHRLNRLGDFTVNAGCDDGAAVRTCDGILGHTAASGTGSDLASFNSYYWYVKSATPRFAATSVRVELHGQEGAAVTRSVDMNELLSPPLRSFNRFAVLLNGFDVRAIADPDDGITDADKLKTFSLSVSQPTYDAERHRLRWTLGVIMSANCASLECDGRSEVVTVVPAPLVPLVNDHPFRRDPEIHYEVVAHFLIVGAVGTEDAVFTSSPLFEHHAWNATSELFVEPLEAQVSGPGSDRFPAALVGFRKVAIQLDRDHHLLEVQTFLAPRLGGYNPSTGLFRYTAFLLFKQWAEGMKNTDPPQSYFSLRDGGHATLRPEVVLVQLKDAAVRALERRGSIGFEATGAGADESASKSEQTIAF